MFGNENTIRNMLVRSNNGKVSSYFDSSWCQLQATSLRWLPMSSNLSSF